MHARNESMTLNSFTVLGKSLHMSTSFQTKAGNWFSLFCGKNHFFDNVSLFNHVIFINAYHIDVYFDNKARLFYLLDYDTRRSEKLGFQKKKKKKKEKGFYLTPLQNWFVFGLIRNH